MPTISVIIPVFNGERTIRTTIESILTQTFPDFELIIINDGSQDRTLQVIASVADTRINVFSYPNAGLSASRNRGIDRATGKYLAFIDADDLWTPDKLEAQLKALQEYPQAAVAYSWTDYIDEYDTKVGSSAYDSPSGDVYPSLLIRNFLENGSNPLIKREALAAVGYFDESLTAAEDWDMYLRLAANYHFVAVERPQILYRLSSQSMSGNTTRQEQQCLRVIERAFESVPEHLQSLKDKSLANLYKYLMFKSLQGVANRERSRMAIRYMMLMLKSDRALLKEKKVMLNLAIKILQGLLKPAVCK